jgi:serine/threonine protein phosphatase 1
MRRTFVIGDIHGCYKTLMALLAKISPDPARDALIFLGDYIDRGPDSQKVIAELLQLQQKYTNFVALKGNHERMFLDFLAGRDREFYLMMGGRSTLKSYGLAKKWSPENKNSIPQDHLIFINELFSYWEDEEYIYTHAGLQPGIHVSQQTPEWLLWARNKFIDSDYDFGKRVIFGHTPFTTPRIESNKIGIDTGAVFDGRLTCLILPETEFVSVPGEKW